MRSLVLFLLRQRAYHECRHYLPADHAFHLGKAYYYDANINPIKAAVAKAIAGIMLHMMKGMGPGGVPWPAAKKEE